jgi:PKD repeat protein
MGYWWNFSDGTTASGPVVSHVFVSAGVHTVALFVTDEAGGYGWTELLFVVTEPMPPLAVASYSPPRPLVGEQVMFDGSYSIDQDGSIVTWIWQFGDGAMATGQAVWHVYQYAGTYEVELTVIDESGLVDEDVVTIVVASVPVAEFRYSPVLPFVDQQVTFYAYGSYDEVGITDYIWSFGDGTYATGWQVTHAYAAAGAYEVELTVRNVFGVEASHAEHVFVGTPLVPRLQEPPPIIPLPQLDTSIQYEPVLAATCESKI